MPPVQLHPSLRASTLSQLPPDLRTLAVSASRITRDSDVHTKIYEQITQEALGRNSVPSVLFLPAFYAILEPDPDRLISTLLAHDEEGGLFAAYYAMKGVDRLLQYRSVAPEAVAQLWPRLWKWMQFFHSRMYTLPTGAENEIVKMHLAILRHVAFTDADCKIVNPMLDQLPGARVMITEIWVHFVEDETLRHLDYPSQNMDLLLFHFMDADTPDKWAAVVEGSGGTLVDLASLIVKHLEAILSDVCAEPYMDWSFKTLMFLARLVGTDVALLRTVRSLGLIRLLVTLVKELLKDAPEAEIPDTPAYEHLFSLLALAMKIDNRGVRDALRAGLLPVIADLLSCDVVAIKNPLLDICADISQYLCYYSVLRLVAKNWNYFQHHAGSPSANRSLGQCWRNFAALARLRLLCKDEFDKKDPSSFKFCDNMQCQKMSARTDFLRCAACMSRYYCSPDCQRADWRSLHRDACQHCEHQGGESLSKKDKAFLRFLVHQDYIRNRQHVVSQRAAFMLQSRAPFYTFYDYRCNPVRIAVEAADNRHTWPTQAKKAQWMDRVHRMAVSQGKFLLDVAVIPGSKGADLWVFPFRTNSSRIHMGLRGLARISAETPRDEYLKSVKSLVEEEEANVVEIHSY
ncbi:hypothetical protein DFH06DRAFT_1245825 [Mycena polygramma]|nr:hypothetical protein DFH06DRAFT_1245825 [Mycena polygramma]